MKQFLQRLRERFATLSDKNDAEMPLTMRNYVLMGVGLIAIILGMVLMCGGGSEDPNQFNYEMFSWRRITLAPIIIVGGFVFEIYALMKKF
ncbi:MAG: DUF3098 domain-containing protein [Alistipes sp.]|nr:DUF3098 domain-containing protein [Alistipes sp.]